MLEMNTKALQLACKQDMASQKFPICHCVGIEVQIDNKVDTRQMLAASWGEPKAYHHAV